MKKQLMVLKIFFCAAVCILIVIGFSFAQDLLEGKALIEALRRGGYVIYFRHAATDWSQDDFVTADGEWTSCDPARMRQLSSEGRQVARRIGEAIRRLKIPIGRVLSSEYCRTKETAQLMALGAVKTTRNIMNMRVADMVGGREAVERCSTRVMTGRIVTDLPTWTPPVYEEALVEIRSATPHGFIMTQQSPEGRWWDGYDGTVRWSSDGGEPKRRDRIDAGEERIDPRLAQPRNTPG